MDKEDLKSPTHKRSSLRNNNIMSPEELEVIKKKSKRHSVNWNGDVNLVNDTKKKLEVISFTPQINKELRQTDITNGSTDTSSKTTSESDKEGESKYGNTDNADSKLGTEKQTPSSQGKVTYNPKTNTWSKNGDSFFSKVGKAIAAGVGKSVSTAGGLFSIVSSLQSATKTTTPKVVKPVVTSNTRTGGGTGKGVVSYLKA